MKAADEGKAAPRITEMDLYAVVVRHGFQNTADDMTAAMQLAAWAKHSASHPMRAFLFKNRSRLGALIDDIWCWHSVEADLLVARRSRLEALQDAVSKPCVCKGLWAFHVQESFRLNGINAEELCRDIHKALTVGRSECVLVIVLAGERGGEGKSLFLKALLSVFGKKHVFNSPEYGSFPLLDLPGKKVCFWDEWRFGDETLSFATQDQLFDGSTVTVNRPQNVQGMSGHYRYCGSAPVFVTTKLSDIKRLRLKAADDPKTGLPKCAEASMLLRRCKIYEYKTRIPKPPQGLRFCAHCFSYFVLHGGRAPPRACDSDSDGSVFL